jgi:hypothetical protein
MKERFVRIHYVRAGRTDSVRNELEITSRSDNAGFLARSLLATRFEKSEHLGGVAFSQSQLALSVKMNVVEDRQLIGFRQSGAGNGAGKFCHLVVHDRFAENFASNVNRSRYSESLRLPSPWCQSTPSILRFLTLANRSIVWT